MFRYACRLPVVLAAIALVWPWARIHAATIANGAATSERPNVLLIITDDQRWDTLSCAGNTILKTPALDRLAADGVRFENAFVTTSTCAPSRASILTGKYVHSNGVWSIGWSMPDGQQSVYEILREQGYYTGHVGKWHMTSARRGPVPEEHRRGIIDWRGIGAFRPYIHEDGKHHTQWEMEQVLDFLARRPKDQPFLLGVGIQAPHDPLVPDPRYQKLFDDVTIDPPPFVEESRQRAPNPVRTPGGRKTWEYKAGTPERYQETVKNYYRLIVGMDEAVGRILDRLDRDGLTRNTLVIFISDNGLFLGEHGLAGKHFAYEESIRVPLIVRYPPLTDASKGTVSQAMALNIDIAPTILDVVGVAIPSDVEGMSLTPLLGTDADQATWRQSWLYEYACPSGSPPMEAVRSERWKYIAYFSKKGTTEELFDLKRDPHEIDDLSRAPEYADTLDRMRREHSRLREQSRYRFWGTHPKNTTPMRKGNARKRKGNRK